MEHNVKVEIWNKLSVNQFEQIRADYFKHEYDYPMDEQRFIKGYMEDGMSEYDADQVLTDNIVDYYFEHVYNKEGK